VSKRPRDEILSPSDRRLRRNFWSKRLRELYREGHELHMIFPRAYSGNESNEASHPNIQIPEKVQIPRFRLEAEFWRLKLELFWKLMLELEVFSHV